MQVSGDAEGSIEQHSIVTTRQSARDTPASAMEGHEKSSCEIPEFDDGYRKSIIVSTVSRFEVQEIPSQTNIEVSYRHDTSDKQIENVVMP